MRLLLGVVLATTLAASLAAACGSDADTPLHRLATDAFKRWTEAFETAEYSTTALGVGERPTGEFDFEGDARYRNDPESVWTILYLDDADPQDERESFQQLRVEDEEFIRDVDVWRHVGAEDNSGSIALENELRSMLGTPIITDDDVLKRWLECAERSFGGVSLEPWRDQPAWIVRCRAHAGIEDAEERKAARELVKSVMATLFGQAPGATQQLEELIEAAEVGYLVALQAVIQRESGALLMVDVAVTLSQAGARSDIRWQMELLSYNVPIEFPDLSGVLRN